MSKAFSIDSDSVKVIAGNMRDGVKLSCFQASGPATYDATNSSIVDLSDYFGSTVIGIQGGAESDDARYCNFKPGTSDSNSTCRLCVCSSDGEISDATDLSSVTFNLLAFGTDA